MRAVFSPSARRLATIAGVAVALGLLTGRAAVVLVGVLPMVLLARVDRRGLDGVRARVLEEPERVLEGEHVGIPVVVTHPAGVGQVACRLIGPGRADAGPAGLAAIAVARRWPDRKDTSSTLAVEALSAERLGSRVSRDCQPGRAVATGYEAEAWGLRPRTTGAGGCACRFAPGPRSVAGGRRPHQLTKFVICLTAVVNFG